LARALNEIQTLIKIYEWLRDYEPLIRAAMDGPKSLKDLQQAALGPSVPGYHDHHIVEQKAAENGGASQAEINDPNNIVRIPELKHRLINGWYGRPNEGEPFNGMSPRDYLRDKGWAERRRVGLEALKLFGVLEP